MDVSRRFAATAFLSLAALVGVACGGSSGTASNVGNGSGGSGAGNGTGGSGAGNGTGGVSLGGSGTGGAGTGGSGANGSGGSGGNGYCGSTLTGTIRDFQQSHPDFEYTIADDRGIVKNLIGADHKPVYAHGNNPTTTVHSQTTFHQWYHDDPVNKVIPYTITLTNKSGDVYTYDNGAFFPIDNQGWGNEGNNHNFHFTFEIHTKFVYNGGEVFTFTGDDDLWTFINGKLAIDLGGVHGAETASVDLDKQASALGIQKGGTYSLEVFSAERHTTESHFRIDTTIASFVDCGGTIQ